MTSETEVNSSVFTGRGLAKATEQQVRKRRESHLMPYDLPVAGDYDSHLAAKAQLVHGKMIKPVNGHVG